MQDCKELYVLAISFLVYFGFEFPDVVKEGLSVKRTVVGFLSHLKDEMTKRVLPQRLWGRRVIQLANPYGVQ